MTADTDTSVKPANVVRIIIKYQGLSTQNSGSEIGHNQHRNPKRRPITIHQAFKKTASTLNGYQRESPTIEINSPQQRKKHRVRNE